MPRIWHACYGGNVSLYNESPAGVVDPTPTIAMVGLIDHENHITTQCSRMKATRSSSLVT